MVASVKDRPCCELGERKYWFREPTPFDVPRLRRLLTKEGIRRPLALEFRVAAIAGIEALGEAAGDPLEANRQKAVIEEWYELLEPVREDDIDEPDFEKRAEELERLATERAAQRAAIFPQVAPIEANLQRHWPPYRDLLADRQYWDDVSAVEIVRLLLVGIDMGPPPPRDGDGMLTHSAYLALPRDDRGPLAQFGQALLSPGETERKN